MQFIKTRFGPSFFCMLVQTCFGEKCANVTSGSSIMELLSMATPPDSGSPTPKKKAAAPKLRSLDQSNSARRDQPSARSDRPSARRERPPAPRILAPTPRERPNSPTPSVGGCSVISEEASSVLGATRAGRFSVPRSARQAQQRISWFYTSRPTVLTHKEEYLEGERQWHEKEVRDRLSLRAHERKHA